MAFNFNRRINPVIPTTAIQVRNNAELVLVTNGFTGDLVTPKFVLFSLIKLFHMGIPCR